MLNTVLTRSVNLVTPGLVYIVYQL